MDKSNKFYINKLTTLTNSMQLTNLLYRDILSSSNKRISAKLGIKGIGGAYKFTFKTKHSIKSYINPNVTYVYFADKEILYRVESKKHMIFSDIEDIVDLQYNKFSNIKSFNIYQDKDDFLIYYIKDNKKEFLQISRIK
jgi:hypothetical protein